MSLSFPADPAEVAAPTFWPGNEGGVETLAMEKFLCHLCLLIANILNSLENQIKE
jgi:hypothetical protein